MNMTEDLYPTRINESEKIIERFDPVIYGDSLGKGLNNEQLEFYHGNGYLIIPGLMLDKVEELLNEVPIVTNQMKGREELILEPNSNDVRSLFFPELFNDVYDRVTKDDRILDIIKQILDSDVYVYQSRINLKQAQVGKCYDWHSDFETWHVEDGVKNIRMLTATILLTDNNTKNGPLCVIPKSHTKFITCVGKSLEKNYKTSLRKQVYGVPSESILRNLREEYGQVEVCAPAGTLVLHDGNLMHGSEDNFSDKPRINFFIVYNSTKNIPGKPFGPKPLRPNFLSRRDHTPLKSC